MIDSAIKARDVGIYFNEFGIDLNQLREHKDGVIEQLVSGLEGMVGRRDIQFIEGRAFFEGNNQLRIVGKSDIAHVQYQHAVLASGSSPISLPGVELVEGGRIMNSEGALNLLDIPEKLLVVGAGYIGLEMGMTYAALGSRVTVVELTDYILPGVDKSLSRFLYKQIEKDFENIFLNTTVISLEEEQEHVKVGLEGAVEQNEMIFDRVLVAVGRKPNTTDLGLKHTAIQLDKNGFVMVDEQRRTDDDRIFAVGDITGNPMLAHKAMFEGKIAAEVIAGEPAAFDVRAIPAVIYSNPQIAYCGLMEDEAKALGYNVKTSRFPWGAAGRAVTMNTRSGITKLIIDGDSDRIIGAGIAGPGAEDLISEAALAIEMGATARDLSLTIHPHPTLSETVGEAAEAYYGLATHIVSRKS
jgi:dihydrolipoamide dehydrogenase